MIDDEIARLLAEWAARHDAVAALRLFGSRAKGTARADSDHDLQSTAAKDKGSPSVLWHRNRSQGL